MSQYICPVCSTPISDDLPDGICPACLLAASKKESQFATEAQTSAFTGRMEPPSIVQLSAIFPEYEILDLVGFGGMGAVYKAKQKNLDRIVALKVFLLVDPHGRFSERFSREAKALARLNHPNIVTVHDFGQRGEFNYLVMEFIDGANLRQIAAEKIAASEALSLVPQLCDALQYAHDNGVVHRDIKPENVLVDRSGRIRIADFGLAKLTDDVDANLTHSQQVMGTLNYMAPEQHERPTEVDHRADIYSLGVVIYELLTGELPLGRFDPPSEKARIDRRLDEIVLRALEKEPDRRYQQVSDFKDGIASFNDQPHTGKLPSRLQGMNSLSPDAAAKTAADTTLIIIGMFFGCIAAAIFATKHQGVLPFSDDVVDVLGILMSMVAGYFFAIMGYVRIMISKAAGRIRRIGALVGACAMALGFIGSGLFVVGSKIDGVETTCRALGLVVCIASGFVFIVSGMLHSRLISENGPRHDDFDLM